MYSLLCVALACLVMQCNAFSGWTQTSLVKQVELGGSFSQIQWEADIQRTDEVPELTTEEYRPYIIYLSQTEDDRLSYIRATVGLSNAKKDKKQVLVERGGAVLNSHDTYWYAVQIPRELALSAEALRVNVIASILHDASPLPKAIKQGEKQYLVWSGDVGLRTPYATQFGRVMIQVPKDKVVSYAPDDGQQTVKGIGFGPYEGLEPYDPVSAAVLQGQVRYQYDRPVITYVELNRHVEISHWGDNMATADTIWLRNDGAKLDGHFSRAAHMVKMWSNPSVELATQIHTVPMLLPAGAQDVYFVDASGNVSTSTLAPSANSNGMPLPRPLEVQPRFPVLGGWNYSFTVGWNQRMSSAKLLKRLPGPNRYRVAVPYLTAPNTAAIDETSVRIVLPEGASDIQVTLPFKMDLEQYTKYSTYLDTVGRPAVILKRAKCTSRLNSFVYVDYTLSPMAHARKILAVAAAAALIFFVMA
ncbi:dolichyl-diphosphooligosaccharide--protein glycosyltransferase subunit 1 [Malassezia yamatoensis]|uniref:Dolichyl-diphosphooligosaccharide--protein glycosyltransferase subunit 1 n=1 Tax=Malassezia yamatoensis TaxID=253288 RepID=A0AAJ5YRX2_9BASI|nr:dolichyl-diphosphooligosaccharide--protein glycosyltransferase subunit 1 [Malassezia yamatoensis]